MLAHIALGDTVQDFTDGSFILDPNSAVGKFSISQQQAATVCTKEIVSSEQADAEDLTGQGDADNFSFFKGISIFSRKNFLDGQNTLEVDKFVESCLRQDEEEIDTVELPIVNKQFIQQDDGGKVASNVVGASDANMTTACPELVPSIQKQRPARSSRKRQNKTVVLALNPLHFTRRKRSERVRSTTWGVSGRTASVLEQNGVITSTRDKPKRSRRKSDIQGNKRRENNVRVQCTEKLKETRPILSGPITLKVKFGKDSIMDILNKMDGSKDKEGTPKKAPKEIAKDTPDQESESMKPKLCDEDSGKESGTDVLDKDAIQSKQDCASTFCNFPFQAKVGNYSATIDGTVPDCGTSPDSDIINSVSEAQVSLKEAEDLNEIMLPQRGCAGSLYVSTPSEPSNFERGDGKDDLCQTRGCSPKEGSRLENSNCGEEIATFERKGNLVETSYSSDASTLTATGVASLNASSFMDCCRGTTPSFRAEDLTVCVGTSTPVKEESNVSPEVVRHFDSPHSVMPEKLLSCSKGQKALKGSKSEKASKSGIEMANTSSREENGYKKKENRQKQSKKSPNKEKGDGEQIFHEGEKYADKGLQALCDDGKAGESGKENKFGAEISRRNVVTAGEAREENTPRNAWVSCDDCHKWRRIPALLADEIEESNRRWVCMDNMDKRYADCMIAQEKSNSEINAELEISDEEDGSGAGQKLNKSTEANRKQSLVADNSSWSSIKSNLFLTRRRKNQTIDEVMVCGCKLPSDGRMGCGHKCLNRMLNIECIPGTCPCGELCSNQQFQKRKYAKLKSIRCGKKGFGLQLLEDVSAGQFLIEYVGEVLDMHSYEARLKDYAAKGHRHFYFMTLNGSEVIDACAKGNLGRFINHSCEPNCRTEKWMVNGEVCIGIFSLRDIKKGEEVTFDYNYVRVFGAAAKRCVCGSPQCRGYIGGDPLNSEVIVQSDSDEEYSEPCILSDADKMDVIPSTVITSVSNEERVVAVRQQSEKTGKAEVTLQESEEVLFNDKVEIESFSTVAGYSDITKESIKSARTLSLTALTPEASSGNESSQQQLSNNLSVEDSLQTGDVSSVNMHAASEECSPTEKSKNEFLHSFETLTRSSINMISGKTSSDTMDTYRKTSSHPSEESGIAISKSQPCTKVSAKLSSDKKKKLMREANTNLKMVEMHSKSRPLSTKPKLPLEHQSNGRFEAVQEKLNELLDPVGGISKRKDASRGYLKLLLLTAASEDSGNGQGIQSNRDLSMILDALLKTKSRTVLLDVINKNGLQMLHNILKRCGKEFKKIPILRKLLKVLEYLATREVVTSDDINGGPKCPGMESFTDSILGLTEHIDKQVHQIARNFRDRWIPRCFRRYVNMDRDDSWTESHPGPNSDRLSAPRNPCRDVAEKPSATANSSGQMVAVSRTLGGELQQDSTEPRIKRRRKSRWDQPCKESRDVCENMVEDVPPGFSSPLMYSVVPSDTSNIVPEVAIGHPQQRFNSRLPVAHGIPVSIVQQYGVRQGEASESWIVAPGMPFQPFPPLPPYPRDSNKGLPSQAETKAEPCNSDATFGYCQNPPSTSSGAAPPGFEGPGGGNELDSQRCRGSNNLGRKYFRQQKWNHQKVRAPWFRNKNNWGSSVNNPRNGMRQPEFCGGSSESKRLRNSPQFSGGTQNGNSFNQHPQTNWS